MKTLLLLGLGSIILVGGLLMTACGHQRSGHGWHSPEKKANWITNKISKELKLNEEQQVKLQALKLDLLETHKKYKPTKGDWHEAIKAQLLSETMDPETLNKLIDERHSHHMEMKDYFISKCVEFHGILNQEQKQTLVTKLEKWHNRFAKFHH